MVRLGLIRDQSGNSSLTSDLVDVGSPLFSKKESDSMFDQLFVRSDALTRYLSAPLVEIRAVPQKHWKKDVALMQFLRSLC